MTDQMKIMSAVAAGGALGALLRSSVNSFFLTTEFPTATLLENIIGSLLLGLLTGYVMKYPMKEWLKAGIGAGFCGGFTTMSTFASDSFFLWQSSPYINLLYMGGSLFGGLLAAWIGILLGLTLFGRRREGE